MLWSGHYRVQVGRTADYSGSDPTISSCIPQYKDFKISIKFKSKYNMHYTLYVTQCNIKRFYILSTYYIYMIFRNTNTRVIILLYSIHPLLFVILTNCIHSEVWNESSYTRYLICLTTIICHFQLLYHCVCVCVCIHERDHLCRLW
jgi:hypothetical protein